MFWYEPTKRWVMVTRPCRRQRGALLASKDLKHWETLSDFGPEGSTGGAWECPDLFELPVEGEPGESRWVLDVDLNPGGRVGGSGAQYFVGRFDGQRFVNENPDDLTLWVDYGKDFYASQSYAGHSAVRWPELWIGWMSNWIYADVEPTAPWRGVQSLPRELALRRTPSGIRLVQSPDSRSVLRSGRPRRQSGSSRARPLPGVGRHRAGDRARRLVGGGRPLEQRRGRRRDGRRQGAAARGLRRSTQVARDAVPRRLRGATRGCRALGERTRSRCA